MTTTIRPAETSDAPQIAALLSELGYPAGQGEVTARLGYWLQDSESRLLVAEMNGHVSGVAAVHAIPLLEYTGRRARLVALVVGQSVRAQGVGRALMKAAEETARDLGCRDMEITSARSRTVAQRFYANLGYDDMSDRATRFIKLL